MEKKVPVCNECYSEEISKDAVVRWDVEKQKWKLTHIFDNTDCDSCQTSTNIKWVTVKN